MTSYSRVHRIPADVTCVQIILPCLIVSYLGAEKSLWRIYLCLCYNQVQYDGIVVMKFISECMFFLDKVLCSVIYCYYML